MVKGTRGIVKKETKKERAIRIYSHFSIVSDGEKILAPGFGWITPLLKDGNKKTGKEVKTFSLLPSDKVFKLDIDGKEYTVKGTCGQTCKNEKTGTCTCYAMHGFTAMYDSRKVQLINTVLVRSNIIFVYNAICAQIIIENVSEVRIHAAGDFDTCNGPTLYPTVWKMIIKRFPGVRFWTYTKYKECEGLFDGFENAGIVRSILPDESYNYGTASEVIEKYNALVNAGEIVHICGCGTPSERRCHDCAGCSKYKYTLFLKHSCNDYKPGVDDPEEYAAFCELVKTQKYQDETFNTITMAAD